MHMRLYVSTELNWNEVYSPNDNKKKRGGNERHGQDIDKVMSASLFLRYSGFESARVEVLQEKNIVCSVCV